MVRGNSRMFLFPVPAGWADDDEHSDQIQKLLQETDSVAGFQLGLDIIVEPEAVAAFVESHYRHKISQLLKNRPSVSILIADIGEGTCDYSLYNVQRINDNLIWLLAQKSRGFRGGIGIFWMKLQKRIDELPNAIEYESENSARTQVFNFEQSASDITVAGTTITKAEVDSYMSDAFDTPLQELRDLYEKSQPACTFVAGQAAASSRYLQSRMREKIGWDDSCVQILEPTQAMTAVIEGALRPEPTMNIEEQFENCFFGLIFIKSSKSPRRARRPRRKRRRKNVETAENLLLLKQPGERISSEWHEFIVNDRQREFRVIPGYTFEGSSMDNNYEPPIIPGEQAIIMDSIVFRLPSDTGKGTGKVDVRVSAVKDGDMVVEVRTPDHRIYSRTCYLDHCRGRIIIVAKPEKADSQIANQQVTPPGDDGEIIAATPEHELTTRQLCLDEVMHTSDGRRASSESIYVTVDDSNSGGMKRIPWGQSRERRDDERRGSLVTYRWRTSWRYQVM
uniref:Uncharacterized protein n=1 Tax=Bionectria ochroleuca TaxID=29856 RepID=A0A8H7K2Z3_BIOOC